MTKKEEYATKIINAVKQVFDENASEDISIDAKELKDKENYKMFIHAMFNIVPTSIHNSLMNDDKSVLEGNHFANILIFEHE